MTRDEVKSIVIETIAELKRSGMLKDNSYEEISKKLKDGKKVDLTRIKDDPYFDIIQLYFRDGCTNEKIAELLGVDVSTVTRNKKRLCLMLQNE